MEFFVFILVAIVGLLFAAWQAHKRRQMWEQVASQYGLRYNARDPFNILDTYDFALFHQGHSRKVYNCLYGNYQDLPVKLFDYKYNTGSGKSETTHHLSAVLAEVNIYCPYLFIRPENFMDRVSEFLGFDDIDFDYEQFNRSFHVKGEDKKFAYDICHSGMMEFLLAHNSTSWELRGRNLLLYSRKMGGFDPEEVAICLKAMCGFIERVPQYLLKE